MNKPLFLLTLLAFLGGVTAVPNGCKPWQPTCEPPAGAENHQSYSGVVD